ncbi:hypothetical protein IE53DRAFT_124432 [Violaceomyces palustris]|uniref:Uncharacterized protein n=1 Tax=Violaceomyces palustris TaxID=1673888 RepID=A0ACD0NVK3_9BASI|nr:hypothetical protein IE53DRAFT_124432 [Violaceomyces palustris]
MKDFPDCILLTRVGGFYESYFDQAPELASMLGIKLASRRWASRDVPMAGFPLVQLEKYLKVLVEDNRRLVAICEEYRTVPATLNESIEITRRVSRVVSAGTLIDEKFLDPFNNNFILSISRVTDHSASDDSDQSLKHTYGLAWLDLGTADFNTARCTDLRSLRDEIARINPRELVLEPGLFSACTGPDSPETSPSRVNGLDSEIIWEAIDRSRTSISTFPVQRDPVESTYRTKDHSRWSSLAEANAVQRLLSYLRTRLLDHAPDMEQLASSVPKKGLGQEMMQIDAHTLAALEIRESSRDGGVRGSLFSVLRRTVTRGGSRLLQQWLAGPSTSLSIIRARHSFVDLFLHRPFLREDMRVSMRKRAGDISRVIQRILTKRNNEQDLLEVRDFISTCEEIQSLLKSELESVPKGEAFDVEESHSHLRALLERFIPLKELREHLGEAIDERVIEKRLRDQEAVDSQVEEEASTALEVATRAAAQDETSLKKGRRLKRSNDQTSPLLWGDDFEHLIRPSISKPLQAMTKELARLRREALKLEIQFKEDHGDHVSLRAMLGQGFVVHARGRPANETGKGLSMAGKNKSSHTYYSERWTLLGTRISQLMRDMKEKESVELEQLRRKVTGEVASLRRNSQLLDQLDVLSGFAQAAQEYSLVRPHLDNGTSFLVKGGRHISVEMGLLEKQRLFTKNDLHLHEGSRLHVITGPNMGGKSTFLRQNAVMAILAQSGSFVPADSAHLGIVDRIFSRIGAKDDLFRDRSTFMVEMMETAEILRRATEKSLVIADEIGRGTATHVGLSIAFATLHELYFTNRCRTLFATHLHELADMMGHQQLPAQERGKFEAVDFFCTDVVDEVGGIVTYSHRIRPGVNRDSHGMKVAQLADMPFRAVQVASATLDWLQSRPSKETVNKDATQATTFSALDLEAFKRATEVFSSGCVVEGHDSAVSHL